MEDRKTYFDLDVMTFEEACEVHHMLKENGFFFVGNRQKLMGKPLPVVRDGYDFRFIHILTVNKDLFDDTIYIKYLETETRDVHGHHCATRTENVLALADFIELFK